MFLGENQALTCGAPLAECSRDAARNRSRQMARLLRAPCCRMARSASLGTLPARSLVCSLQLRDLSHAAGGALTGTRNFSTATRAHVWPVVGWPSASRTKCLRFREANADGSLRRVLHGFWRISWRAERAATGHSPLGPVASVSPLLRAESSRLSTGRDSLARAFAPSRTNAIQMLSATSR